MGEFLHGDITRQVLGAAFRVHRALGPGFLESVYEHALTVEFTKLGIPYQRQHKITIKYSDVPVGIHRLDLLVANEVIVELKAVSDLAAVHHSIILAHLAAADKQVALLLNFSKPSLEYKRFARTRTPRPNQSA